MYRDQLVLISQVGMMSERNVRDVEHGIRQDVLDQRGRRHEKAGSRLIWSSLLFSSFYPFVENHRGPVLGLAGGWQCRRWCGKSGDLGRVGVGPMRLPSCSHKPAMPSPKVLRTERILTCQPLNELERRGCRFAVRQRVVVGWVEVDSSAPPHAVFASRNGSA